MSAETIPDMSCPLGGTFYACGDGSRFIGCCNSNPCDTNSCEAGNLVQTSFDPSQYGEIPDMDCESTDSLFYTCTGSTPPFWGCCKTNPCSSTGCPSSDLAGAILKSGSSAQVYLAEYNSSFASTTPSSSRVSNSSPPSTVATAFSSSVTRANTATSETATTSTSTANTSSSALAELPTAPSSTNIGAIAGGAVGGATVLLAFIFGLIWLLRRRRSSACTTQAQPVVLDQDRGAGLSGPEMVEKQDKPAYFPPPSPSAPSSPQPPYSPGPPGYAFEPNARSMSYELPGSPGGTEMDSGQFYHPYRQDRIGT